jgi:hypothetical protein
VPLPLHPHFFEVLTALDRPEALRPLALLRTFGRPVDSIAPSDDWTPMDLLRALSTVPPPAPPRPAPPRPAPPPSYPAFPHRAGPSRQARPLRLRLFPSFAGSALLWGLLRAVSSSSLVDVRAPTTPLIQPCRRCHPRYSLTHTTTTFERPPPPPPPFS